MRKIDKHFMIMAEKIAHKSDMKHKVAALVVDGRTILSVGYNRSLGLDQVNGPVSDYYTGPAYSIHAEIDAIRKAFKVYPEMRTDAKLTMYVARNKFKLAKPCESCQQMIDASCIDKVIYTDGEP